VKNKDFYTFYVGASKHTLMHQTECTAAGNPDNARTTIGIGELVDVYLDPPLQMTFPENPWWTVSGQGTISPIDGSDTTLTAKLSPGSATVTLHVRDVSMPTTFSVIAPDGIAAIDKNDLGLNLPRGRDHIGASTLFRTQPLPTTVSFGNISIREVVQPTSRTWPDGEQTFTEAYSKTNTGLGCITVFEDTIEDGPLEIYRLSDGTGFQPKSFTQTKDEQYLNESGEWVHFTTTQTTVTFRASDQACQETFQGLSGIWQGPWQ
jgi:hypothetical protein